MPEAAAFEVRSVSDRRAEIARWRRRSRAVRSLRIVLPAVIALIAAALVGEVVWRNIVELPTPQKEARTAIRLLNAHLVGRVKDGRSFEIGARQAIRDENDYQSISLMEPVLVIGEGLPNEARMSARIGAYNERDKLLRLRGGVRIVDGKGHSFASQEAIIDTRTGNVVGQSQVQGDGPLGQLNAKSYSVQDKGDRLVFKGGVHARIEGH
ncbi:MAG: LPS export ABC transporter periplasmic protein LptC [Ignavibacteriales bacterium]